MRILVTGGNGFVGKTITRLDPSSIALPHNELDITNRHNVMETVAKIRPDCIIHAAGITDVDYCELHPEEAYSVNAIGTKNIADACKKSGARLVYISTDYVFDGTKGMYREEDATNPISAYAKSKLAGEKFARELDNHATARTSTIYGNDTKRFVYWVLNEISSGKIIKVAYDEYKSPTHVVDAANAALKLANSDYKGILHCAGNERISKFDFAVKIAQAFGKDINLIHKIKMEEVKRPAPRPKDSSLDVRKALSMGIELCDVETGLKRNGR
ncbi:MAG TPA: dTDP-4-dehydrorhamnose reductase [archaeon]|nr:dTDP-4-dehydrorhamnose reductase [archaeon]